MNRADMKQKLRKKTTKKKKNFNSALVYMYCHYIVSHDLFCINLC